MGLYVDHKDKWGFIHIPKTGGTSIKSVLDDYSNADCVVSSHQPIGKMPDVPNYFIFTMVRNPFTRLGSAYHHYCRRNRHVEFSTFIKTIYETAWN